MKYSVLFFIFLFLLVPGLSAQDKTDTIDFKGGLRQFHSLFSRSLNRKMEDHVLTSNYYFQIDVNENSSVDSIYEITGKTDIRATLLIDALKNALSLLINPTGKKQGLIIPVFLIQADAEDKPVENPFLIDENDFKKRWPVQDKIYMGPFAITYYETIRCSMSVAPHYDL